MTRGVRFLVVALVTAGAAAAPHVFAEVAARVPVAGPQPAARSVDALLAWAAAPLASLAVFGLYLAPAWAWFPRADGDEPFGWFLRMFAVALGGQAVLTTLLAAFAPGVRGSAFAVLCGVAAAAGVAVTSRGDAGGWERRRDDPLWRGWWGAGVVTLVGLGAALAPHLHWEGMNGDGVHAFESVRRMLEAPSPFWSPEAGILSAFPGPTSVTFAWPGVWFMRLLGEMEGAARLPALFYLLPMGAGIFAVARAGGGEPGPVSAVIQWAGSALFMAVLAFSATYSPYVSDLALPGTQDTLFVASLLGFIWAFVAERRGWMAGFAFLTCAGLPSGVPLLGLFGLAALATLRPVPWGRLVLTGGLCVGAVVLSSLLTAALTAGTTVPVGHEYSFTELLDRIRALDVSDWARPRLWVIPAGIVPAVALLLFPGQTGVGRAVALLTLLYAGLFQVQYRISLHYFVPAMVLPWVVVWTHPWVRPGHVRRVPALGALGLGLVAAWGLSWQRDYVLDRTPQRVGAWIQIDVPGYDRSDPRVFLASELLGDLVPGVWEPEVPDESYGGSPLVWLRYAGSDDPRVRLRPDTVPPHPGWIVLSTGYGAALDVRDAGVVDSLRALRPGARAGVPLYRISKDRLF